MDAVTIDKILCSLPEVDKEYPFEKGVAAYTVQQGLFAILPENKLPIPLSLRCDQELSKLLRVKYETVMPGQNLNPKKWNTILLTGQLPLDELEALIRHSYELVKHEQTLG